ncbi:putative protein-lysine deacylase ABHD14B [Clytia hemisphaerica]|uniref:putative protein-lysine deacylase ABHD14B n=1 Tax=Clytia hemisphaerica TaxID=252671 RepID=UPI0034D5321C
MKIKKDDMGFLYNWKTAKNKNQWIIIGVAAFVLCILYLILFTSGGPTYTITTKSIEGKSYTLAIRERTPRNYSHTVVLLHSDKLDSTVWENIKTLEMLYNLGYRAIAIDLPGFGKSYRYKAPTQTYDKAVILEIVLKELDATNCILVVPSMSGSYALPLVIRGSFSLNGFVAISPHFTERFTKTEYTLLKTPTMIIYGQTDKDYGEKSANDLMNIPDSKIHVIKGAGHACYLQNPEEFNEVLKTFLDEIKSGTFHSVREEQLLKKMEIA